MLNLPSYLNRDEYVSQIVQTYAEREQFSPPSGYVYFAESVKLSSIKIGFSRCPSKRIESLKWKYSSDMTLVKIIHGTPKEERFIHNRFSGCLNPSHPELFWSRPELVTFINKLATDAPLNRQLIEIF